MHHRTVQIGVPADGAWDFVDAYEHRFCYDHGQNEWLLRAEDTWMLSDDFGVPGARGKLDGQVNRFQNPSHPQPSLSKKQAECDSTLWSQVDTATDIRESDGKALFKIRWKLHWIPESDIDNLEWVQTSYAAKSRELGRRRSGRSARIPNGLTATQEAMMRVIRIE